MRNRWPDEETLTSTTFRCIPSNPVQARYVRYQISNARIFDCAGLEVLDSVTTKPFDLRLVLPEEAAPDKILVQVDNGAETSGVPDTTPSWGAMLSESAAAFQYAPWLMLFPGIALFTTTLAFNLVGDGLRDALDPRTSA